MFHNTNKYDLFEEQALVQEEQACLADKKARERSREREAERRVEHDRAYIDLFAKRIRELFPFCPPEREVIAEHACLKYSGRIGRTASAKDLEEKAVLLAVIAHIRNTETSYDRLLAMRYDRREARSRVEGRVDEIIATWSRRK